MEIKKRNKEEKEMKEREEAEKQRQLQEKQIEINRIRAQNEERLNNSKYKKLNESILKG